MLTPGTPQAHFAKVWHRRNYPKVNEFCRTTTMIWIDPSSPEELFKRSRFWRVGKTAPIRFNRTDYFVSDEPDLGQAVRNKIASQLGTDTSGELRMLTQPRILGWLFNPITVFVLYDTHGDINAVLLEVTNTPWKETQHYVLAPSEDEGSKIAFEKKMHVSPFLGMDYQYLVEFSADGYRINVIDGQGQPIVETAVRTDDSTAITNRLSSAVYRNLASTLKTSASIHWQALVLWLKRVGFKPHPSRKQ